MTRQFDCSYTGTSDNLGLDHTLTWVPAGGQWAILGYIIGDTWEATGGTSECDPDGTYSPDNYVENVNVSTP